MVLRKLCDSLALILSHTRLPACRRSLGVAFQDLQALMGMAADMVKLAERFRGVMSQVSVRRMKWCNVGVDRVARPSAAV